MSEFLDLDTMLSKIPVPRLPRPLDESVPLHSGARQRQMTNTSTSGGSHWTTRLAATSRTKTELDNKLVDRPQTLSGVVATELQPPEIGSKSRPVNTMATLTAGTSVSTVTADSHATNANCDKPETTAATVTVMCTGCGVPVKSMTSTLESDVRDIRRMLQTYAGRLGERDANARTTKQWRLVARVFDRLFFFIYCATIIVSLATIFPRG